MNSQQNNQHPQFKNQKNSFNYKDNFQSPIQASQLADDNHINQYQGRLCNQPSTQKKLLQNFLNQNISQSDIIEDNYANDNSNYQQQQLQQQQRFAVDISPIQARQDQSFMSGKQNQIQVDPRKGDTRYACLLIKRMEFYCTKENLSKHSNYLFRVFENQDLSDNPAERDSQIRIKMNDETQPDILLMFIDYVDRGKEFPNKINLRIAVNIVLIAEALKMRLIQKKYLIEVIMPLINRENVIYLIRMAYTKLSSAKDEEEDFDDDDQDEEGSKPEKKSCQEEEEFWIEFFSYSLDVAAANIQYLIKKKQQELHKILEASVIDEIIERAIRFYRADLQYDNTLLFDTLMKVRKCDSIFQLLDQERQKIIQTEGQQMMQGIVKPTLTWRVQNLSGNFYRESDPFWVENAQWKLSISYFSSEQDSLNISIKMVTNPFEVKKSKDYFKKKEYFLPSNLIQNHVNPIDELEENEYDNEEELQKRRKQIEQANAEYPSHSFITLISAVRINHDEELKDPQVHTLICSAKSPALLKKVDDFNIEDYDGEVTVEIYFKVKYIYSSILHYISRNFTYLFTDPIIHLLPKDQFKLILKHKYLNVIQEDEVIKALCLWVEEQEPRESLHNELKELLENVNWNYVTTTCFIDIMRNFPMIRRHDSFKKIVNKEFQLRLKFNPESSSLDPPRFCYKFNKTQNSLGSQQNNKNQKNSKALLYINHDNFFVNMVDSLLEPVDIIRGHLVNEGITESSHRKFLEIQLLQKQRELVDIQQQINNMKLLENFNNNNESRSNSRQQFQNNSILHLSRNNGRNSADEQETVKNSMINLLNVIDNNSSSKHQQEQQQQQQPLNFRNISQEIVQQMNNMAKGGGNVEEEQSRSQSQCQSQSQQSSSILAMYERQQLPGRQNKIQILFQSCTEEVKSKNPLEFVNQHKVPLNYEEQQLYNDDHQNHQNNINDNAKLHYSKDSYSDDSIDHHSDNEQELISQQENKITEDENQKYNSNNNNNKQLDDDKDEGQEEEVKGQSGVPTQRQELQNIALPHHLEKEEIEEEKTSQHMTKVPKLTHLIFASTAPKSDVIVNESKSIQTSIQQLISSARKDRASLMSISNINSNNNNNQVANKIDQGIQMSLQSERSVFRAIDNQNSKEEDEELKESIGGVLDDGIRSIRMSISIQDEEVVLAKSALIQSNLNQKKIANQIQVINKNTISYEKEQKSDQQAKSKTTTATNEATEKKVKNLTVNTENDQPNYSKFISSNLAAKKPQTQTQDQQFLKQIQEYTEFVQQLSKDAFDANFLDKFLATPNQQNSYPQILENIIIKEQTQQNQSQLNINNFLSQPLKSKSFHNSGSNNNNQTPIINQSSTQPFTPASNLSSSFVNSNYNQSILNVNTGPVVSSHSSSKHISKNLIKSPEVNGVDQQSFSNNRSGQDISNQSSIDSRAKSQNPISLSHQHQRGMKIYQKRINQAIKVNQQSHQVVNSSNKQQQHKQGQQINRSQNNSVTRNKPNFNLNQSNQGHNSVKHANNNSYNRFQQQSSHSKHNSISNANTKIITHTKNTQSNLKPNNKQILNLQKLLEESGGFSAGGMIDQDLNNMPMSLLGYTGNTENNFQEPVSLTNESMELTAQMANYKLVDQLYQQQMQQKPKIQNKNIKTSQNQYQSNQNSSTTNDKSRFRNNFQISGYQQHLNTIEESKFSEMNLDNRSQFSSQKMAQLKSISGNSAGNNNSKVINQRLNMNLSQSLESQNERGGLMK